MMTKTAILAACAAALITATNVEAAQAGKPAAPAPSDRADRLLGATTTPTVNAGEAYHRADDSQQDPAEVRTTQALNAEIASRNELAENQERADRVAFETARANYEAAAEVANQDRLDHEEALRQSEAARRQWEQDQARWEADARACRTGRRARCAPPRP